MISFNKIIVSLVLMCTISGLYGMDLLRAARTDNIDRVRELIAAGTDVNIQDINCDTPLHWAVSDSEDNQEMALVLIAAGANLNIKNKDGWTPLHQAVFSWNKGIVQDLIVAGADTSILDNERKSALEIAVENNHAPIAWLIFDAMETQERQAAAQALAKAFHPRLGQASPASMLPQFLMADIVRLAIP